VTVVVGGGNSLGPFEGSFVKEKRPLVHDHVDYHIDRESGVNMQMQRYR
jgi:hypothetical protein